MFTRRFIRDAAERSISTAAQTLIAVVGTNAASVVDAGLRDALLVAVVAGVLSLLKSIAAYRGPWGGRDASLVDLTS